VTDDTGALESTRRIQVQAAGNEWTLHVPDDLRLHVNRIENLGRREAYRKSRFFRTAEPRGYVERQPRRER
jgi:hypothetical protein